MPEENREKIRFDLTKFTSGAERSGLAGRLAAEIEEEQDKDLLDQTELRRSEDWNEIANRIVGS